MAWGGVGGACTCPPNGYKQTTHRFSPCVLCDIFDIKHTVWIDNYLAGWGGGRGLDPRHKYLVGRPGFRAAASQAFDMGHLPTT